MFFAQPQGCGRDFEQFVIVEEFEGFFDLDPDLAGVCETYCAHSQAVKQPDGSLAAWCVQPRLPVAGLLSKHFGECSEDEANRLFQSVLERIVACVSPSVGLDGQLSNWILDGNELRYLDGTPKASTRWIDTGWALLIARGQA